MELSEVAHHLNEHSHVGHLVEQVLIDQLLWNGVAHGLLECSRAIAVSVDDCVLNHLALFALEVLELVGDQPSVQKIQETFLNS